MRLTKSLAFTLTLLLAGLIFGGTLYAQEPLPELSPTDTAPITQTDIDIFCKYCELANARFKNAADITSEKLTGLWGEAGWSQNRAGFAISRISTMYEALIKNDETARSILEFMGPDETEMDLVIANQESLAHALSLLEKFELKF